MEDDKLFGEALKQTLALEGWDTETIGEGNTALELILGENHYDVLIFDNELPSISGLDLIYETRQLPHRQQTPIIMLTASNVEREARRNGANIFLRKPDEIALVTETIARLLARKHKSQG